MLRLRNQMIQCRQKRFECFLAHRCMSLKPVQMFYRHVIVKQQPPGGDVHPTGALLQIMFEWSRKEKPLIVFFFF